MADTTYYYYSDINSFPTTKMESVNKLITENSLTRLINRLLDIDGFIITDGLAEEGSSEIIGNGGKHLKINNNLRVRDIDFRDNLFEFVIRGYYFSIPFSTLKDLIDSYIPQATESIGLYARIFIDNTNPQYPELVGQTAYEEGVEGTVEGNHYGVQFFVCPVNNKPTPSHPSLPVNQLGVIEGLGTTYLYFDLMLLEYIKDDNTMIKDTYIPFESLCKFDSHSVNIIDGGVVKLFSQN